MTDIPIELHKQMLTRMVKIKLIIKRIIFILNKFYKVPYTKLKADKNKMLNGQDCWRLILRSSLHFLSLRSSRAMQLFPPFHNQDSKTTIWAAPCHLSFFISSLSNLTFPDDLFTIWWNLEEQELRTHSLLESHIDMTCSPTGKLL